MPASANLATTEPAATYPHTALSHQKVLIVYNSDVSWSLVLATRYARRKRIPSANLIGWPMGTNMSSWTPPSKTDMYNLALAVVAQWEAIEAQVVLIAPGCPDTIRVVGVWTDDTQVSIPAAFDPVGVGYPPLEHWCAGARYAVRRVTTSPATTLGVSGITCAPMAGTSNYIYVQNYTFGGNTLGVQTHIGHASYFATGSGVTSAYNFAFRYNVPKYSGGVYFSTTSLKLPSAAEFALLGASSVLLPYGRIGSHWNRNSVFSPTTPTAEITAPDFEYQAEIMERALRHTEGRNPANKYRTKSLFVHDTSFAELTFFSYHMEQWGYSTDYSYRNPGAATADMIAYAPTTGQLYTETQLTAGDVKHVPYHLMAGMGANYEPFEPFAMSAWDPDGGGSSVMGPSQGWAYPLVDLGEKGISGLSHIHHITTLFYQDISSVVYNLLRGASWAEAAWTITYDQAFGYCPVGDPLARPFPAS